MANAVLLDSVDTDTTGTGVCDCGNRLVAYSWADTWGGGTVTFQSSPDDGTTWFNCKHSVDNDDASFTANGCMQLGSIGKGALIRAVLSGSTNPSNVSAKILEY